MWAYCKLLFVLSGLGEVKVTARKKDPIEKRRPYSEGFVKTSTQVKASNSFGDVRQLLRTVPGITMVPNSNSCLSISFWGM